MTQELKRTDEQLSKVSREKIKTYSVQIEQTWHKTLESIFAIGDLLIRAKTELKRDKGAYEFLIDSLSFGARTAQRLVAIAETPHFRKSAVQKSLPPCWTILDELRGLSEVKFNRALKNKAIRTGMTRNDAIALAKPFSKQNGTKSAQDVESSKDVYTYANLTFNLKQSSDYTIQKTLLDVQFITNLVSDLFEDNSRKKSIEVKSDCVKPSKKLQGSEKVFTDLIAATRKIENHHRKLQGKAPLNKRQEILTLLGLDPDYQSGSDGFSLLERLAVSYAKRNGITCIKEEQLKWYAAKSDVEPELLGSFMEDVEKQVAKLISGRSSKRGTTEIYELDSDEDEIRTSRNVLTSHHRS